MVRFGITLLVITMLAQSECATLGDARPWENSLQMKFVPVPGTKVLFCIWETRVRDYEAFTKTNGQEWSKPDFAQGPTHPAVNVSWDDATAFCAWLTKMERKAGRIGSNQCYRLPTDAEWSAAVGLTNEPGRTPGEKDRTNLRDFPWGKQLPEWPPPPGAGNFDDYSEAKIPGYRDGYEHTAPVGSFKPNRFGLYDLSGNVWEWCEDWSTKERNVRVLRGGSWANCDAVHLLSSDRFSQRPEKRYRNIGFRVVLASGQSG